MKLILFWIALLLASCPAAVVAQTTQAADTAPTAKQVKVTLVRWPYT